MEILLSLGIAFLVGLLITRVFKPLKLPSVTSFLIAGVLVGPYVLGRLGIEGLGFTSMENVEKLGLISDVALGFIAFSIGNEFRLSQLEKTGKQATIIGILQAFIACIFVDAVLIIISFATHGALTIPQAITLGAIATATAPAATLMVVKQFKAKGPLVDILLPIVALDDAVGLIVFAVSLGIAKSMVNGQLDMLSILVNPAVEIILSLALGGLLGELLTRLEKLFNSNTNRLNITLAVVILGVALCKISIPLQGFVIGFSPLLTCMMIGTMFCNTCTLSEDLMEKSDRWTRPLLSVFFVISGAQLELNVFTNITVVLVGLAYIISRSAGKYFGAKWSAKLAGCNDTISKYLGITLLPQAGVALGMCVSAKQLGEQGDLIRNITLFAILIYEIIGPVLTKEALIAAGDIKPMGDEVKNRRQAKLEEVKKHGKRRKG